VWTPERSRLSTGARVAIYRGAPHELPPELSSRCAELVASLGLEFGAIDLLLEPDGRYWFCEINPNGEWGWLQNSGLPIAEALASRLLDG
jgi:glutathione synthase/RimK-type ligase-like ATP-grasp enzyme